MTQKEEVRELLDEADSLTEEEIDHSEKTTSTEQHNSTESSNESSGRLSRMRQSSKNPLDYFSKRGLIGGTIGVTLVSLLVGFFIPIVPFTALIGLGLSTLLLGFFTEITYPEIIIAGAVAGGVSFASDAMQLAAISDIGAPLIAVAPAVGIIVAMLGLHFGRDVHKGLTEDIDV